jgi:hypothetical protein
MHTNVIKYLHFVKRYNLDQDVQVFASPHLRISVQFKNRELLSLLLIHDHHLAADDCQVLLILAALHGQDLIFLVFYFI